MESPIILQTNRLKLYYGAFEALKGIDMQIPEKQITAFIGPSGCGKSTFLKTLNRMNDLVPGVRIEGEVLYNGRDIFSLIKSFQVRLHGGKRDPVFVFQPVGVFIISCYLPVFGCKFKGGFTLFCFFNKDKVTGGVFRPDDCGNTGFDNPRFLVCDFF